MHKVSLLILLLLVIGCGDLEYRGWTPSVRTMADQPATSDYYVGADLRFAVVDPEDRPRKPSQPPPTTKPIPPSNQPNPIPEPPIP